MTIYQVVYYNQFGERVADFGYYEDKLDAEQRAFEIRMKTSPASGEVCIEDIMVHDSTDENFHKRHKSDKETGRENNNCYGLK